MSTGPEFGRLKTGISHYKSIGQSLGKSLGISLGVSLGNALLKTCAATFILSIGASALAQTAATQTRVETKDEDLFSYGVDLRDVARYNTGLKSEAQLIINAMKNQPEMFFPQGVRFLAAGPGYAQASRVNSVYGVEFTDAPTINNDGSEDLTVNALFNNGKKNFTVRTFRFHFQAPTVGHAPKLLGSALIREVPLGETHFTVKVTLAQRKLIIEDTTLNIRKIFPIGAGALEESPNAESPNAESPNAETSTRVRVLTPKYNGALIERRFVESARTYPSYYAGRPFIRLSVGVGGQTIYGFHYSITESLIRGFVSHGCMRMRDKDLYELYAIVMAGGSEALPVEMAFNLKDKSDNPYPLNNQSYYRVKNFGTASHPQTDLDREGLTILENHRGAPPVTNLFDPLAPRLN